jgi:hypothetical protein
MRAIESEQQNMPMRGCLFDVPGLSCEDRAMLSSALLAAAALLLFVAGIAKLRTPGPAAQMLVTVWPQLRSVRRARMGARLVGIVEAGASVATMAIGTRAAIVLLLVCYVGVTAVAVRLAFGSGRTSCGCFGAADGAVGVPHLVVDAIAVAITVWAAARPPGDLATLFDHGALTGVTVVFQVVVLTALAYLSLTALPALVAARRTVEGVR